MKKIVSQVSETEIPVASVDDRSIVAYRKKGGGVGILARLTSYVRHAERHSVSASKFGFVSLNSPTSDPTYVNNTFFECLDKAHTQRKLYVFENMEELIKAVYQNKI